MRLEGIGESHDHREGEPCAAEDPRVGVRGEKVRGDRVAKGIVADSGHLPKRVRGKGWVS